MFDVVTFTPDNPLTIAAALVALLAAVFLTHPALDRVGRDSRLWRRVRALLPYVDDAARDRGFYTTYPIRGDQYVGTLDMDAAEVRELLRDKGFRLAPLAAHKSFRNRSEIGSWGRYGPLRPSELRWPLSTLYLLAWPFQLHVMLFPGDEGVLVAAHHEFSPYNPLVAYAHLRGKRVDVDRGVREVAAALADVDAYAPSDRAVELVEKESLGG